ncbi:MAG TPA: hypothetical protein VF144_20815 [Chitinophagaceae bacterium]
MKKIISISALILLAGIARSQRFWAAFGDSLETRAARYRYHLSNSMQAGQGAPVFGSSGVQVIQVTITNKTNSFDTLSFQKEKVKPDFFDAVIYKQALLGKSKFEKMTGVRKQRLELKINVKKEILSEVVIDRIAKVRTEKFADQKSGVEKKDSVFCEAFIRYSSSEDPAYYVLSIPTQTIFESKMYFNNDSLIFRPQPVFKKEKMNKAGQYAGIEVIYGNRVIAGIDHPSGTMAFSEEILIDNKLEAPIRSLVISSIVLFLETMNYSSPYGW